MGDVSEAVPLDKWRYARCTQSAEPSIIDITSPVPLQLGMRASPAGSDWSIAAARISKRRLRRDR